MLALQDVFDMREDKLFKAASGLSGGIGEMRDTCGALLGPCLMLGMVYGRGRDELENQEKMNESYIPVAKLYKWFEKEYGSTTCKEIITRHGNGVYYDATVPWQRKLAREAGVFKKDNDLVGRSAARAAEMIWDALHQEEE